VKKKWNSKEKEKGKRGEPLSGRRREKGKERKLQAKLKKEIREAG